MAIAWVCGSCTGQLVSAAAEGRVTGRVAVPEIDNSARSHLERADVFLANEQYAEAVETMRRVMDTGADSLIAADQSGREARSGFVRYITLRRYCQEWLADLGRVAPAALTQYRAQVDPLAEEWLKQADAERDPRRLQRIADEFFASSVGDQAVWRLGSYALEQGEFRRAREYWEQASPVLRFPAVSDPRLSAFAGHSLWWLLRDVDLTAHWDTLRTALATGADSGTALAFPDSDLPLSEMRARLALVSILEGDEPRARFEIDLLSRLHPQDNGTLGGRTGRYTELLESLLTDRRSGTAQETDGQWPTFAGHPSRNHIASAPVDLAGKPVWQIELPRFDDLSGISEQSAVQAVDAEREVLCHYPVASGQLVVVNTGISTVDFEAVDLQTGRVVIPRGHDPTAIAASRAYLPRTIGVPRFAPTLAGERVYARAGCPITGSQTAEAPNLEPVGRLVAIDLLTERRLSLEIKLEGPQWAGSWAFEGSPLYDRGRLFAALRRRDSVRAECHVACFDAAQGHLLWRRFVCAAETPREPQPHEITHTLLACDQETLFCNTNLGAVAALRATTGEIQWLTTYPRTLPRTVDSDWDSRYLSRDLNPCVVYRDFVFAAPADSSALLALDAITGQVRWSTDPDRYTDVVHLLGVGHDRLLAGGDCLNWLDIYTGKSVGQFPQALSTAPGRVRSSPRGRGRGVLAGSYVYWPTHDTIFVLQQETELTPQGWQPILVREIPLEPRGATGGNLVIAGGMLLIATADRLYAFNETGSNDHAGAGRRPGRAAIERGLSAHYE